MHTHTATLTFQSRIDWWLAALVFGVLGLAAWRVAEAVVRNPSAENWVAVGVTGLVVSLFVWFYATTAYDVGPTALVVRCGPLRESIPIASIRRVSASRTLLAGPALSLRRLKLEYGKYDTAVVSPSDQAGFIAALTARNSAIEVRA